MNRTGSFGSTHRYISSLSSSSPSANRDRNNMTTESEIYEKLSKERPAARKVLSKALHTNMQFVVGFLIIGIVVLLVVFTAYSPKNSAWFSSNSMNPTSDSFRKNVCISEKCQRLANYCTLKPLMGVEGQKYINTSKFELYSVLITMRHGDRSPIHSIPGDVYNTITSSEHENDSVTSVSKSLTETSTQRKISTSLYSPKALSYANEYLSRFRINLIKSNGDDISLETLKNILSKSATTSATATSNASATKSYNHVIHAIDTNGSFSIFSMSDTELPQGHLTSTGYMQLIQLGDHLKSAYGPFVSSINSSSQVYIRSTNYHRTIQSVAALGTRFLPPLISYTPQYRINTYLNEMDEIMHGVGMKYSSHKVDKIKGETPLQGSCIKAYNLSKTQSHSFQLSEEIRMKLNSIVSDKVLKERPITNLVDAALPKYCHQQPLPCIMSSTPTISSDSNNVSGSHSRLRKEDNREECTSLTEVLLADMMIEADRNFCNHYTGIEGGDVATKLAIYPFITEILGKLKLAATASSASPTREKVNIFSGHDTVISPVLSALGVYKNKEFCNWPPLASRIVFELYKSKVHSSPQQHLVEQSNGSNNNNIKGASTVSRSTSIQKRKGGSGSNTSKKKKRNKSKNSKDKDKDNNDESNRFDFSPFYVRVLFNGQDITIMIPVCNLQRDSKSKNSESTSVSATANTAEASERQYTHSNSDNKAFNAVESNEVILCPLVNLSQLLSSMIAPYKSFHDACAIII